MPVRFTQAYRHYYFMKGVRVSVQAQYRSTVPF